MSGLGGMSGIPPPPPETDWTSILASTLGGGVVGFLAAFLTGVFAVVGTIATFELTFL